MQTAAVLLAVVVVAAADALDVLIYNTCPAASHVAHLSRMIDTLVDAGHTVVR